MFVENGKILRAGFTIATPKERRMQDETKIAIMNYDWLMRNRDGVAIEWNTGTLLYGDGGGTIENLCERGFTPATSDELLRPR